MTKTQARAWLAGKLDLDMGYIYSVDLVKDRVHWIKIEKSTMTAMLTREAKRVLAEKVK